MEELRSRMARKAPDGEARPDFGSGLRPASSVSARIEEYAEMFDGFAASCTIPVLELPPAIDGYGEAVGGYRSLGLDYSEIFEALDAGNFALSYEELVYRVNGLKEEEEEQDSSRVQEDAGVGQQETRASDLFAEESNEGRTIFSELNQSILSSPLNCVKQQLNFSCGPTCQQRRVNELDCMICISQAHANFQPDFEAEIVSSIGFAENYSPKNILSDDYRLTGDLKEEEAGKHGEVLDQCFASSIANGFENNLEDNKRSFKYPPSNGTSENLKRYSRSSSYHSTLSGDIPFPDYTFVTISEVNLHTRPLQVPPPLRSPPKLYVKQGMTKSMAPQASNTVIDNGTLPMASKSYQANHFGGPRTHHALKETLKSNSPVYFNVVDASKSAAASMVEAMEQAQARLKSAKESRERMRDSLQCYERFGSNDPWTQNGLNIDFSGGTRHKTKGAQKVVPNHEKVTTLFFVEEAEEAMHGKESGLCQLPHELEERSHEWKIEKQFYELVSIEKKLKLVQELPMREWDEKLMTSRVIDDENRNCIKEIKLEQQLNTYQCFSEKECCGNNGRRFTCSNDDEVDEKKGEFFEKSLNESILFSKGELHVQDGSAKVIKSGIMVDREEIIDILETYPRPYLLVEDEFKQKEGCILQIPKEGKTKLEDIINIIRNGRNENELKKHHESHICSEDERTANFGTEAYVCEDNLEKLVQLQVGKNVGKKLAQDKDSHGYTVSESCVVIESDSSKADECIQHARKVDNSYETSLFSMNERLKEGNMASLHNASTFEVDLEYRASFSCDQEKNVEAIREECQLVKLQKTKTHTYVVSYNVGNDTELEGFDITSKQESRSFSEIYETCEAEENEKKDIHYQMAKLDLPNRNELKSSKVAVPEGCLVEVKKTSEASEHWLKGEKQKMYELPGKSENHENMLNAGDEERKGENIFIAKVQASLELEKKIMGLSSGQQVFDRIRVKDQEAVQQPTSLDSKGTILSPSIDASGSSLLPPMENISDEWIDIEEKMKENLDRERKQPGELQRKLAEQEREREREKDRTGVEKATHQACERAFSDAREGAEKIGLERVVTEARHRPLAECRDIAEKSSSEVLEKFKKATNQAKLRAERAAVERAAAEIREGAIARTLTEQASLEARRQTEASTNFSKERSWKYNEADNIIRPAEQENSGNNLKPTDEHDAPNDAKLQCAGGEGQSPLRCKARQERHQRIVDRVAKALVEKNMRDILAQREESERNRLADSLDVEIKRWSNGKEGNLRALLSTLQYILGPDSGWHPISLTDVLTAAAVKKAYRKATLYVHPDKLQQRGAGIHHKYICEKVFDLLKDAWNKFNSDVR